MVLTRPADGWNTRIARCASRVCAQGAHARVATDFDPDVFCSPATVPPSLGQYLDLLVQWNARLDLTAARDADEAVDLFFADALLLALVSPPFQHWVDVGTGAGAPGLPLKLLRPDLSMTLVEPKTKRCAFLRTALSTLGDLQTRVERKRGEDLPAQTQQIALSRATLAPAEWLAEGSRIATQGVWVLLAQAEPPTLPGWQAELDLRYEWPLTAVPRRALRFAPTP
jgi:16S rRNA (guanine527-N7)-methyltransferase